MANPKYTIKSLKFMRGHEGNPKGAFECSLYRNGKMIGYAVDDSWGGGIQFQLDKGEQEKLDAFCRTLPKWHSEWDNSWNETSADIYIDGLVQSLDFTRSIKRKCSKNIIVVLSSYGEGEYLQYKMPYTGENLKRVLDSLEKRGESFKGKDKPFIVNGHLDNPELIYKTMVTDKKKQEVTS